MMVEVNKIDPNQFIITRKRKKYRFAKFANAENCFEFDQWKNTPVDEVEIGAGTGLSLVELASRHPERMYAAIDVKADRLQKGAYAALDRGIDNIYFIRARADQVDELFDHQSVDRIWLTFSDPFPKKRSAGRRITHPSFLEKYKQILRPSSGNVIVKHDNPDFFNWTLEQLVSDNWRINQLTFDLHESALDEDYKILTTYEERWLGEGRVTKLVSSTPCHRAV